MKALRFSMILCSAITLTACNMDVALTEGRDPDAPDNTDTSSVNDGTDVTEGPVITVPDTKTVSVLWSPPYSRMNGDSIGTQDLEGYELRYRKVDDTEFEVIKLNNTYTQYTVEDLEQADYVFEVAAIDTQAHSVSLVVQLALQPEFNSESGWNGHANATLFRRAESRRTQKAVAAA